MTKPKTRTPEIEINIESGIPVSETKKGRKPGVGIWTNVINAMKPGDSVFIANANMAAGLAARARFMRRGACVRKVQEQERTGYRVWLDAQGGAA